MAVLDICNAALLKNHWTEAIPATVDWLNPTGKAQVVCAQLIAPSRRAALRLGYWSCIMRRTKLASAARVGSTRYEIGDLVIAGLRAFKCTTAGTTGTTDPAWDEALPVTDGSVVWTFQYATADPLREENYTGLANASPLPADYVMLKDIVDSSGESKHFVMEGHTIFTDFENPVLVYVPDEQDDTKYDALLREAVILELAMAIAGPLTSDRTNESVFAQELQYTVEMAFAKTGREARQGMPSGDEWVAGLFNKRMN